jgi:tripartite-type tricarboxylate transporter receptor subunit TctC
LSAPTRIGRPFFGPPGMAPARLAQLRAAFDEMVRDRRFLDDAKASGLDVNPVSGSDLAGIVDEIVDAPADVRSRLASVLATASREH